MLEVARVLKLTHSVRSLKSLTSAFSQNFPGDPNFFKILTTTTKGGTIPKSEGITDVRDFYINNGTAEALALGNKELVG